MDPQLDFDDFDCSALNACVSDEDEQAVVHQPLPSSCCHSCSAAFVESNAALSRSLISMIEDLHSRHFSVLPPYYPDFSLLTLNYMLIAYVTVLIGPISPDITSLLTDVCSAVPPSHCNHQS